MHCRAANVQRSAPGACWLEWAYRPGGSVEKAKGHLGPAYGSRTRKACLNWQALARHARRVEGDIVSFLHEPRIACLVVSVHFPVGQSRWPGRLVQLAVVLVVAAMAAATFMLSYAGVRAIALQAGVPRELARFYPGVLDAALVIACAAAPALRDARWWTRCYAWLAILVVAAVIGGIDAVHAMSVTLPHRATAGVAAVLPWALLLLAFSLWLTIAAHQGGQRTARPADVPEETFTPKATEAAAEPATVEPATVAEPATGAAEGEYPADHGPDEAQAAQAEPASPDAGSPPSAPDPADLTPADTGPAPGTARDGGAERDPAAPSPEGTAEIPAVTYTTGPRLRRVRSLPAPPVDEDE